MDAPGRQAFLRLKKVLLNDKNLPNGLMTVLRSDLTEVFASYFDYDYENLDIDITVDGEGRYKLRIDLPLERVKNIKVL